MTFCKNSFYLLTIMLLAVATPGFGQAGNNTPPFGWVDTGSVGTLAPNTAFQISGWAVDLEDGAPISKVQVVLDGSMIVGTATLGLTRTDVSTYLNDTRYQNSGWSFTYTTGSLAAGQHSLTVTAFDSQGLASQLQGTATFTVSTAPFGWIDSQTLTGVTQNTVLPVAGWAVDPTNGAPVASVQILLDGASVGSATLGTSRSDVAAYFNDARYTNSGWSFNYTLGNLSLGQHALTAIATNTQGVSAPLQGSLSFSVTAVPPFGWLDYQSKNDVIQNTGLQLAGWAADQSDGAPIAKIQLILDGSMPIGNASLGTARPDVATYFNDIRYTNSGWTFSYNIGTLPFGQHTINAVAYNSHGSSAQLQGTVTFDVPNLGPVTSTDNPQVASYMIQAPDSATVSVQFGVDQNYGLETGRVPAPAGGGAVRVLVAGMKANTAYHLRAVTHLSDGSDTFDTDHVFTTTSYSSDLLPTISVTHFNQAAEAPGLQMLDCLHPGKLSLGVVDRDGNVIWAYTNPADATTDYFPAKMLPNGDFLLLVGGTGMREVDLSSTTISELTQPQVQAAVTAAGYQMPNVVLHHDFQKLPNGHFILLGQIQKSVTLDGDSTPTNIVGDVIIDVDQNLQVKWAWSTFDHLDVNRHPVDRVDWTHGNAVLLTPDGNLLLSMRHQSWIIKIDYQNGTGTGNIIWRLGYQGDFTLESSAGIIDWFYLQHYPNILSEQNGMLKLAVFDNGDNRILDPQGDICGTTGQIACYSRGIVLDVDENAMTASLEYQHTLSQYSFWGGSIQQMPNGNYVAAMSATSFGSRAEEFTGDASQTPVWQMDVMGQNPALYRSLRLPSLYPNVTWK